MSDRYLVEVIWNLRLANATMSHLPGLPIIYLPLTFSHIPLGSSSFPNWLQLSSSLGAFSKCSLKPSICNQLHVLHSKLLLQLHLFLLPSLSIGMLYIVWDSIVKPIILLQPKEHRLIDISISYCCCNKLLQTTASNNTDVLSHRSGGQKSKIMALKSRCWQGCVPSGGSRREFVPLSFSASRCCLQFSACDIPPASTSLIL